jgi:enoyl-CoA hydratase/carnithine racemase
VIRARVEDGVGRVTLARPEKRNALTLDIADAVRLAAEEFASAGVGVAVLDAEGPVFCAGNDLDEARADPGDTAMTRLLDALLTGPVFWVAVVEGPALGGGVPVVCACPVVLAADDAWLALPEVSLGVFPSAVMAFLEGSLGPRAALTAGLTGDRITAPDAAERGLVTEAVPRSVLRARVADWTDRLTARPAVTAAALASWQSYFATPAFAERQRALDVILRAQDAAVVASGDSG